MTFRTLVLGSTGRILLGGRLMFDRHADFIEATREVLAQPGLARIELDLSEATFVDSSFLGMLLVLRERAQVRKIPIYLASPRADVRTILELLKFPDLFGMLD